MHVILFFAFPPVVRCEVNSANAIESLHSQLGKIIKTRVQFPCDDSALTALWLALHNALAPRVRSTAEWN